MLLPLFYLKTNPKFQSGKKRCSWRKVDFLHT